MANIASGKSHWRYAHAEAQKWKQLVFFAVGSQKPIKPLDRVKLTLTRFSSVEPDFDGLVRGFKSVVDSLRHCGVMTDDKISNTGIWDCRWVKAPKNSGSIRVIVEEV